MDARTEAAGHAIFFAWNNSSLRNVLPPEERECLTLAEHALAAADSVSAPLSEQLAAALRDLIPLVAYGTEEKADANAALAVFDAARADSQGTADG